MLAVTTRYSSRCRFIISGPATTFFWSNRSRVPSRGIQLLKRLENLGRSRGSETVWSFDQPPASGVLHSPASACRPGGQLRDIGQKMMLSSESLPGHFLEEIRLPHLFFVSSVTREIFLQVAAIGLVLLISTFSASVLPSDPLKCMACLPHPSKERARWLFPCHDTAFALYFLSRFH